MSRDITLKDIKELTEALGPKVKKVEKKPEKKPYAEGIDWLSESIDIDVLFRVKGRQGIFTPTTKPNKSGLVRMQRFMSGFTLIEAYTVHSSILQGLGGVVIYKENNETITLSEAFDNLQLQFKNQSTGDIDSWDKEDIMAIICPGYHVDKFRDYHAKKIIMWYNEIVSAIKIASN